MNTNAHAEFVIHKSTDSRQSCFVLRAANHEVVLTSETYTTKDSAKRGIEAVRTAAQNIDNFVRRTSHANEPYFVLRSANREVIGTSEMYSSPSARDEGVLACQRVARVAVVRDAS